MKLVKVDEEKAMLVGAGNAPIIVIDDDTMLVVDSGEDVDPQALRFALSGRYIVIPLERWRATLGKAIKAQAPEEKDLEVAMVQSRQVRRAMKLDRRN